MTNELEKVQNTSAITNAKLIKCMDSITKELQTISRVSLRICAIVSRIHTEELYADDYTDFEEFGTQVLNVKKATLYNMSKVGRDWTDGKGHSIFFDGTEPDYSLSQIYAIMRVKVRKGSDETPMMVAQMLHDQGIISPNMKTSDIKEAIAAYNDSINPKKLEEKAEEQEGDTETLATEVLDGQYEVKLTMKWLQLGNSYKIDVNGDIIEVSADKWQEAIDVLADFLKA